MSNLILVVRGTAHGGSLGTFFKNMAFILQFHATKISLQARFAIVINKLRLMNMSTTSNLIACVMGPARLVDTWDGEHGLKQLKSVFHGR